MQRLLVALLAALDAAVAAAAGLAVLLAPLTLMWTFALGTGADWAALWPATGMLWQFGHGVPIDIALPEDLLLAIGVPAEAAQFSLSLTPLAFALFTFFFAARSGTRAARARAWISGVLGGTLVFALIAAGVAATSATSLAKTPYASAIVLPVAIYLAGALCGAIRHAWQEGDDGLIDRVHDIVDSWAEWGPVPSEAVRGALIAVTALTGAAALLTTLAVAFGGSTMVTLFETLRVDAAGVTVISLAQFAYLPTLIVWAMAWMSGAGFAVGSGTAVSPAGTDLGVVPGVPILGLLPSSGSFWWLIVVIVPVAAGALAGWMVRSRMVWENTARGWAPRLGIAAGIAALSAGAAALLAVFASGSMGPGRLAETGPAAGAFALAIGVEVLVGAGILLLAPRHRDELAEERTDRWISRMGFSPSAADPGSSAAGSDAEETVPLDELGYLRDDETGERR